MNTKKLSTIILGSALVLGLGASNGSFAQQAAQQAVQQVVIDSATVGLLTGKLAESAAQILGIASFDAAAATAQQISTLNQKMAANPQFAAAVNNAINAETPEVVKSPKQRGKIRTWLATTGSALALSAATIQAAAVNAGGSLFARMAGHDFVKCTETWKDPTAQKAVIVTVASLDANQGTPEAATNNVVANLKAQVYNDKSEEGRDVKGDACKAMNQVAVNGEPSCDIVRLTGCPNGRPPRAR